MFSLAGAALVNGSGNQNRASKVFAEGRRKYNVCILHFIFLPHLSSSPALLFISPHLTLFLSLRNINMELIYLICVSFSSLTEISSHSIKCK